MHTIYSPQLQKSTHNSNSHLYSALKSAVDTLTKAQVFTLNHIIQGYLNHDFNMYHSQGFIAQCLGVTRQTVNRAIAHLQELKLVQAINIHQERFNFDSLRYIPHRNLFRFKDLLRSKLRALKNASWHHLVKLGIKEPQKLSLITNVTPYKEEIFISKPCISTIQLLEGVSATSNSTPTPKTTKPRMIPWDYATRVLNCRAARDMDIYKRTDFIMNADIVISPILREITTKLRLTKLGQIKLHVFSDDALEVVWKSYQRRAQFITDPVNWLVVSAEQYSKVNGMAVDWALFYMMLKRYNVPNNGRYTQQGNEVVQKNSLKPSYPRPKTVDELVPAVSPEPNIHLVDLNSPEPIWKQMKLSRAPHPDYEALTEQFLRNKVLEYQQNNPAYQEANKALIHQLLVK